MKFGPALMAQAEALSRFTSDAPRVTRTYLSPEHKTAGEYLLGLMRDAGMEAGFDALGNIVGRYAGAGTDAPTIMTGSHQDSVRNAGKYDGLFGILTAIACVKDLHVRGKRLPCALEIVGFGDEEGVRFGVTLIGSKAMAGAFDPAWLVKADAAGVSLAQAIREFGGNPDAWPGLAGHAGTVPMGARQDALTAASEMVLAVERYCEAHRNEGGLVGTVGILDAKPGAANVIPQDVSFTVDVRSGDDGARNAAVKALQGEFGAIAARRGVQVAAAPFYQANAAPCHPGLQAQLARAIAAQGVAVRHLPSGAGHDAMVFPVVCPTAMLFVRCGNNGISHHPDETMTAEDAEVATAALLHFFEHFEVPG